MNEESPKSTDLRVGKGVGVGVRVAGSACWSLFLWSSMLFFWREFNFNLR